jgi:excisionase family DNA binding protein
MKPTPTWTPDELISELDRLLAEVPDDFLPEALGILETSKARLTAKFLRSQLQPARDANKDKLLDVPEAAKLLGMSESFIYKNRDSLPHTRIGCRLLFPEAKLRRFLERRTTF